MLKDRCGCSIMYLISQQTLANVDIVCWDEEKYFDGISVSIVDEIISYKQCVTDAQLPTYVLFVCFHLAIEVFL